MIKCEYGICTPRFCKPINEPYYIRMVRGHDLDGQTGKRQGVMRDGERIWIVQGNPGGSGAGHSVDNLSK